ncbi:MAG: single-stranded DNA-binding protein [Treponemataceae bacterium]|nr:single-stranded DNA-binding protein [Treponemataceae bacterium]
MNPLNSVLLEGNVVRQPDIKHTGKGTPHCSFPVASTRYWKSESGKYEEEVSFIEVTSWGALAQTCRDKATKGRGVRVVGRLQQGRWKDNDGKMQSRVSIIAEHIDFKPDRKKEEAEAAAAAPAPSDEPDMQHLAEAAATPTQEKEEVTLPF